MSIRSITCYVVECDGEHCEKAELFGDGHTPHFTTWNAAHDQAFGVLQFRKSRAGALLCDMCARVEDCKDTGHHKWGDWLECLCGGTIPSHAAGCRKQRWCGHCGRRDPRPGAAHRPITLPAPPIAPIWAVRATDGGVVIPQRDETNARQLADRAGWDLLTWKPGEGWHEAA